MGTLAGLVVLGAALALLSPHFLTASNLLNVLEQTAINAIIAAGMTFVIVSGGIDLSVGSLVALSGIVLALALQAGWPVPLAMAAGLATGAACGLVNGVLVTFGRLPPFIATLGMMSVARGLALVLAEGRPISGFDAGFRGLATGQVLGLPMPAVVMILAFVAGHVVLTRTRFGRTSSPSAATRRPPASRASLSASTRRWSTSCRARRAGSPPPCSRPGSTRRSPLPVSCTSSTRSRPP